MVKGSVPTISMSIIELLIICICFFSISQPAHALFINEFSPNPDSPNDESEWIELYNPSNQPLELTGYHIDDVPNEGSDPYPLGGLIEASGYYLISKSESKISLNNTADSIILTDSAGDIVDQYSYQSAIENVIYARIPDGGDWQQVSQQSPGTANLSQSLEPTTTLEESTESYTNPGSKPHLRLSEIAACPAEPTPEWIEIYNADDHLVSLDQVTIIDAANNKSPLTGTLESGQYYVYELDRSLLNNSGDTVSLLWQDQVIDQIDFGKCTQDSTFIRFEGVIKSTDHITKGQANVFSQPTPTIKNQPSETASKPPPSPIATNSPTPSIVLSITPVLTRYQYQASVAGILTTSESSRSASMSSTTISQPLKTNKGVLGIIGAGISFMIGSILWVYVDLQ